jgi:hypothetical protein
MKQDQNKHLRNLARKIAKLENDIRLGKDIKSAQDKIEDIMCSLSFGEVIYIDNYINKKNLTK